MDAVRAAVTIAREEEARVTVTRAKVKTLVAITNAYVPWVMARKEAAWIEAEAALQRAARGSHGSHGATQDANRISYAVV